MKIEGFLKKDKVDRLPIRAPLLVEKSQPTGVVMTMMKEKKVGCALVSDDKGGIVGIFTERDVLRKVVPDEAGFSRPVETFMSPSPKVLKMDQSIASVIKLMGEKRYRNLPVIDFRGQVAGYINIKDVVRYLASFFPCEVYNLPPNPHQIPQAPEGA